MKRIAVLIPVAPEPPYPRLFSDGPSQTWLNDLDTYSDYFTYSGLKMNQRRKMLSDLRDCLRFPGRLPREIGTTNPESPLMVAYSKFLNATRSHHNLASEERRRARNRISGKLTRLAISGTNHLLETASRLSCSLLRQGEIMPCNKATHHLYSRRLATMTNHTRIQRDVLSHLYSQDNYDGYLFCTASVFVDWKRFRIWVEDLPNTIDFASVQIPNSSGWSYGGTVTYFSKNGVRRFINASNLDYALLQDLAIGKWLSASTANWCEIPTAKYEHYSLDFVETQSVAPVAVICTNHRNRSSEALRMKQLAASISHL